MDIKKSDRLYERLRKHNKYFSDHPELAYKEYETSEYIYQTLKQNGAFSLNRIGNTGIEALLKGNTASNHTIMIRAEMDAVMIADNCAKHLCGHNANLAIAITLAEVMSKYVLKLKGNIKFIFQPAEELADGAKMMIKNGVLNSPDVNEAYALHMLGEIPVGSIALSSVPMASGGQFSISVYGETAHAASPHYGKNAIVIAAELINEIQTLISKTLDPLDSAVITVAQHRGGIADNLIPELAEFSGTIRFHHQNVKKKLLQKIERIITSKKELYECGIEFNYCQRVPCMQNNCQLLKEVKMAVSKIISEDQMVQDYKTMYVDDFSEYLRLVNGVYILIGCQDGPHKIPLHHADFHVGDKAMVVGFDVLYQICSKLIPE